MRVERPATVFAEFMAKLVYPSLVLFFSLLNEMSFICGVFLRLFICVVRAVVCTLAHNKPRRDTALCTAVVVGMQWP